MIDTKDIEIYLKAKKEQLYIELFQGLSALMLAILVILEIMKVEHDYTTVKIMGSE